MFYNPPIHLTLGLSALLIGIFLAWGAPATDAEVAHISHLPALSVAQLDDTAAEQEVLFEGQISANAPTIYRNFVAYTREEYRSRLLDENEHWIESERVTPPFSLRLTDGEIAIFNNDYDFPMVMDTFREAEPTVTRGAVRSRGLRAGTRVFAVGTIVNGPNGRGLHATQIYPGIRAEYVAKAQRWSRNELRIGLGAILIGLAELSLGGWQLRRFLHEVKTTPIPSS